MDVFSPALENRNAGSLGDCISPASRNKKKQERSGDVFTPASRNEKKQEHPGVIVPHIEIKTS